jgi:hypothetical protein
VESSPQVPAPSNYFLFGDCAGLIFKIATKNLTSVVCPEKVTSMNKTHPKLSFVIIKLLENI